MSKKNKVIKLASKSRDKGKSYLVTYNGVEMTRAEREALIRASNSKSSAPEPSGKKAKKGTKVAEPSHSRLFNLLHPKKKQTVAPNLKSVENTEPVVEKKQWTAPVNEPVAEPVFETKPEPETVEKPVPASEDSYEEEEDYSDEEDDLTEAISKKNAKKRISPNFVKMVCKTSSAGCDECLNEQAGFAEKIAEIDALIKAAKTPKDATDEQKAEFNAKRKALRARKKKFEADREILSQKAIALERAADGYSDIYMLLTGKELSMRKTERINPYTPLTEELELEVLNSLWANKGSHKAHKKK
ncbi:MAG: hypothetical protein ACTTJW_07630 [Sphaerochaeta sp.]